MVTVVLTVLVMALMMMLMVMLMVVVTVHGIACGGYSEQVTRMVVSEVVVVARATTMTMLRALVEVVVCLR